jgi:hypothetical protein
LIKIVIIDYAVFDLLRPLEQLAHPSQPWAPYVSSSFAVESHNFQSSIRKKKLNAD